jgi:nucleoside-diphosphate-sugar epimerase
VILVTGGTGYIGRHLVSALADRAMPVRVLVRDPARATILPPSVQTAAGDLADTRVLDSAVRGVRAVVHLAAAMAAARDEQALVRTNVRGTASLAKAARSAGVEQVVYISSAGIYGIRDALEPITERDAPRPDTAYQRSKLAGEEEVKTHAPSWTVLRPSDVFGPSRQQTAAFVRSVGTRRFWFHTGTITLENPAYVHDLVAAIVHALEHPALRGETINVAGPRVLTHREVVDATAAALGRRMAHVTLPRGLTRSGSTIATGLWSLAGRSLPPRLALMSRDVINRGVSTDKARRLGVPSTSLEQAMATVVSSMRAGGEL